MSASRAVSTAAVMSAGTAPSGANQQPWRFVVVSNPDIKREIRLAAEAEERENYDRRFPDAWKRHLDPLGQATVDGRRQPNRHRRPASKALQRGAEASVGEDRRVDAAGDLPQVVDRRPQPARDLRDPRLQLAVGGEGGFQLSELHAEGDELLLDAVVQVTFDSAASVVCRGDDAAP